MQEIQKSYLEKIKKNKRLSLNFWQIVLCLSLVVTLIVFWCLKLTGITKAGEAFCGMEEHTHVEECYEQTLICDLAEGSNHTHAEECYSKKLICEIEEHTHVNECYSDIKADVETADDWEMSLANVQAGKTTADTVVAVAQSQLGYTESTLNFQVDENGIRRGITRYGQWYGNPYADWSAMFVSFCLEYANVTDIPTSAGPETMRLDWEKEGMYKSAGEYAPKKGNIVFLNKNTESNKSTANAVAIIAEVTDQKIKVIEGDLNNTVAYNEYRSTDPQIIGYGIVPEISRFALLANTRNSSNHIATVTNYNSNLLTDSNSFVFYITRNSEHLAFDGSGNAVPIRIENGKIYADIEDPNSILWSVEKYNNNSYAIQNAGSGRYLHPFYNSSSDNGITTPGRWGTTISASSSGVKFTHSAYITFDSRNNRFSMTRTSSQNLTFNVGVSSQCSVWLDGTNGGIMSLGGSDDRKYSVHSGSTLTLPTEWKSPDKYKYVLKGWYDIINNKYYKPGDEVVVTGNMVFYADWKSETYDIGKFNSDTTQTISTNSFVKTRLFDYGALLNVLSEKANVSVSGSSHSETWQLLTSGNNPYNNEQTLNFIFRDWDRGSEDISYPSGHNDRNNPTSAGTVYSGLYTDTIKEVLFNPELQLPGKEYLGEGDHLFQLCMDTSHEHYGYYYYNSERNAASYNQTDQRFYVYDYLECTRDSANGNGAGTYSDFLPLNSPYANSNGKKIRTYSYEGVEGEYNGTTHYMYDSKYSDNNNSPDYVGTNYWFGMSVEVDFYLPNAPGTTNEDGQYGNLDVYGNDMHFRFTGDDDVWVFVDDKMVLDLGGLHGRESGDVNFSTGVVTINDVPNQELSAALKQVTDGEHKLTLYYLERGSSLSNCAIYFNLAPRFDFSIQKEDVLTRDILNGAKFSVYKDRECTIPAELWVSKESHDKKEPSTNTFTVTNGVANMWGMGAGNTYYIRETKPPDSQYYGYSKGIIRLSFDRVGTAEYSVEILEEENVISPGFIVHGFRIDAEKQQAFLVATNAPEWVKEVTTVEVMKNWSDGGDHSGTPVTVYLTIRDADGTVRRLQEATLSSDNNWYYKWENLPKYLEDGKTLVQYGVEESYVAGYYSTVERKTGKFEIVNSEWKDVTSFTNGKTYILKNSSGKALSTLNSSEDTGYKWVDLETAITSPLALWTASVKNNTVRFTNKAGQTITFYYGNGRPTDIYAYKGQVEDNNRKQYFTFSKSGNGFTLKYSNYFIASSLNSSSKFNNTTQSRSALSVFPCMEVATSGSFDIENEGYLVTNTPLEEETSFTVNKKWHLPSNLDKSIYEREQVTIKLYANGVDTNRSVTLNLKNNWTATFLGLPLKDADGNLISYTVKEEWDTENWAAIYGEIISSGGNKPTYSTTVTNEYRTGIPLLPATGSVARLIFILCGAVIMLTSLVLGIVLRLKRERRPF